MSTDVLVVGAAAYIGRGVCRPCIGNWEGETFNLATALLERLHDIVVQIHNDAVVQGPSEVPNMKDVRHWGVMTIGTGLGNARFTNRTDD